MKGGLGARPALLGFVILLIFGLPSKAEFVDLVSYDEGATLSNVGDYDWWYGCGPTAAGMLMGYYDRNGYGGLQYGNLVPGGAAESTTFGIPNPSSGLVNAVIASPRHISDYYSGGYGAIGDDVPGAPTGPLNCLADFMGTSQDSYLGYFLNNSNGGTTSRYYTNGAPATYEDIYARGPSIYHDSGMYGIFEYVEYSGYDVTQLYNQFTDNRGLTYGFTFQDYKNEIDAGRPLLVKIQGHAMFGYGYDDSGGQQLVILNDTWSPGPHTMTWGGSYAGRSMVGVTVLELTGGQIIPEPTALVGLVTMIPAGVVFFWRRRRR